VNTSSGGNNPSLMTYAHVKIFEQMLEATTALLEPASAFPLLGCRSTRARQSTGKERSGQGLFIGLKVTPFHATGSRLSSCG